MLCYFITPKRFRWVILLLGSYLFYIAASKNWVVIFILVTTLSIYLGALWIEKINDIFKKLKGTLSRQEKKELKEKLIFQKKIVVVILLIINLGLLVVLKYYNFFAGGLNSALFNHLSMSLPVLKFVLPMGISFYTLQAIGYFIDVYRGKYKAEKHLGKIALFLIYFPTIVQGPITRYDQIGKQLYEGHAFNYLNFTHGSQLILWGLFKKIVIADRANMFVNHIFQDYAQYSGIVVMTGILFYTIQLYTEFSGAVDICRGSSQMFGIELPKNFNQPFLSKDINEFWQRWHITLGLWLKEYVFFSVSLSKPFKKFNTFVKKFGNDYLSKLLPATTALFFVWICNGLWHGASIKYVGYGMYYYVIMLCGMYFEPIFKKIISVLRINIESKWFKTFQVIRTIVLVNIGMLIFRADSLQSAFQMLKSCFVPSQLPLNMIPTLGIDIHDFVIIIIGAAVVYGIGLIKEKGISIRESISSMKLPLRWTIYIAAILVVVIFGAYGKGYDAVSFIYATF